MRFLYLALAVLIVSAGCASTNDPDAFGVRFTNDLGRPVVLALCNSDHSAKCEHPAYRDGPLRVGDWYTENIAPDVRTEWAVETPNGRLLRCVNLYWEHYHGHEERFRLSGASRWANPCPPSN
jgi:hypothetical protein